MKKFLFLIGFLSLAGVTSTFAQSIKHEDKVETSVAPIELKAAPAATPSCCAKKATADKSCAGHEKAAAKSCSGNEKAAGKSSCCQKGGHADAKLEDKTEPKHKN